MRNGIGVKLPECNSSQGGYRPKEVLVKEARRLRDKAHRLELLVDTLNYLPPEADEALFELIIKGMR